MIRRKREQKRQNRRNFSARQHGRPTEIGQRLIQWWFFVLFFCFPISDAIFRPRLIASIQTNLYVRSTCSLQPGRTEPLPFPDDHIESGHGRPTPQETVSRNGPGTPSSRSAAVRMRPGLMVPSPGSQQEGGCYTPTARRAQREALYEKNGMERRIVGPPEHGRSGKGRKRRKGGYKSRCRDDGPEGPGGFRIRPAPGRRPVHRQQSGPVTPAGLHR